MIRMDRYKPIDKTADIISAIDSDDRSAALSPAGAPAWSKTDRFIFILTAFAGKHRFFQRIRNFLLGEKPN